MNPISSSHIPNAADLHTIAPSQTRAESGRETDVQNMPQRETDRFVHAPAESPGKYWVEPGMDGPAVKFEAPRSSSVESASSRVPEKKATAEPPDLPDNDRKRADTTTCNTDRVDQELKALRQRTAALRQDLRSARSEEEAAQMEKELAQAERELAMKDNDAYRRAHAQFS